MCSDYDFGRIVKEELEPDYEFLLWEQKRPRMREEVIMDRGMEFKEVENDAHRGSDRNENVGG